MTGINQGPGVLQWGLQTKSKNSLKEKRGRMDGARLRPLPPQNPLLDPGVTGQTWAIDSLCRRHHTIGLKSSFNVLCQLKQV